METPNNRRDNAQQERLCHQVKPPVPVLGYNLLGPYGDSQTSQGISKATGDSQPDNKALLMKKTFNYVIKNREVKLVPS